MRQGFESRMHAFQHFLCSYLSVSTIPFQKTETIYTFLWETHVSKFVPHEHVLATWNVLSWLSLSTLSKHYQPCLSCWEIDSKWLKNNNSVEEKKKKKRFESGTSGSKPSVEVPFYWGLPWAPTTCGEWMRSPFLHCIARPPMTSDP